MTYLYCVYKITNLINQKSYIGKTSVDTSRRWNSHIETALDESSIKYSIHKAMAKYGVDNFKFKVIKKFKSEQAAYKAEIKYIKKYNTFNYETGYNETMGGTGLGSICPQRKLTDKQVKLLIKDYIKPNISSRDLMRKYNLAKPCVLDIVNRKSYLNVKLTDNIKYQLWLKVHRDYTKDTDLKIKLNTGKLSEKDVKNIFKDYASDKISLNELSKKYNVVVSNLSFILRRETQKYVTIDKRTLEKVNQIIVRDWKEQSTKQSRQQLKYNIFLDYSNGINKKDIALKYDLDQERVVKILNGSYLNHLYIDPELQKLKIFKINQLSKVQATEIIKDYLNDIKINDLIIKFNTKKKIIKNILIRNTFSNLIDPAIDFNLLKLKTNSEFDKTQYKRL